MNAHIAQPCRRGALISIEGVNGVGKTYLTERLLPELAAYDPLVLEEFSARGETGDLGRNLLGALRSSSKGDFFLRGGTPIAEALILAAIKMDDLAQVMPQLAAGRLVIEGRGLHTTAVYQAAIAHPGDQARSLKIARSLLATFAAWRALPDLTILVTDDPDAAIQRAEDREGDLSRYGADRDIVHQVSWLYGQLWQDDSQHIKVLDRSIIGVQAAESLMCKWIASLDAQSLGCLAPPIGVGGARQCRQPCGQATAV